MESLDRVIEDGNGDSTELHEMIADDNAVDVVARLDARLKKVGFSVTLWRFLATYIVRG